MKKLKYIELITNVLLFAGIIFPAIGFVGVILMWKYLNWPKRVKIIITIPYIVVFLLAIFVIVYLFFFRPYQMRGTSMEPTFHNGAYFITKVLHNSDTIYRSDMIIFRNQESAVWIKRVIGLPGERIKLGNGQVHLNGKALLEPYLTDALTKVVPGGRFENGVEVQIPSDSYFVLGDNRRFSADSREWGFVSRKDISGKVLFCYFQCK